MHITCTGRVFLFASAAHKPEGGQYCYYVQWDVIDLINTLLWLASTVLAVSVIFMA